MSPSADHILREDGITADLSLFLDAVCSIYVYCLALSDETNISKRVYHSCTIYSLKTQQKYV